MTPHISRIQPNHLSFRHFSTGRWDYVHLCGATSHRALTSMNTRTSPPSRSLRFSVRLRPAACSALLGGAVLCCHALRRSLGCCVLDLCAVLSRCALWLVALCRLVSVGVVRLAVCCAVLCCAVLCCAALLFAAVCCAAPLNMVSGCAVLCCPRCGLLFCFRPGAVCCAVPPGAVLGRVASCCAVCCLLPCFSERHRPEDRRTVG